MKIGVDIRVLMDKYYSGVAKYTANLLKAILNQDKTNDYKLFYNSFQNLDQKLKVWERKNSVIIGSHIPNKLFNYFFQKFFFYPKLDKILGGVDVFWSPHFNFSSFSKSSKNLKKVITVHDLSFLRYPEFFSARKNFWHRALAIKKTLLAADAIIAVSNNTKNDLIELIGIKPQKITVIYSGNNISKREIGIQEKEDFLNKYKLGGTLVLCLGNIEPRKNILGLIKAFNLLKSKKSIPDLKLVLAGATGWKNKKIYRAWKKSPVAQDIVFLGYISTQEQEVLYSIASVFVYPSFYEGFGFPPLEAMTYGLPVICSNVSSLPEVVGRAALTINPFSPQEIARAMDLILSDKDLRQKFINEGYERIKMFSWEKTATEYLKVFQGLSENRNKDE
jgi:glycosyltransferase involved in cell wall biosynthesis